MSTNFLTNSYTFMERLTRKWWLYLIYILLVFIPPLTSTGFFGFSDLETLAKYTAEILIKKKEVLVPYMPIFHIAVFILVVLLIFNGNKFGRFFSVVVGLQLIFTIFIQAWATTPKYGSVIYLNALISVSSIAITWFWEALIRKINFTFRRPTYKDSWIILIAVFAFWNPDEIGNYSLKLFLTSTSPIAFCMMSTIYLAILCILFPKINIPLFRIFSFIVILISSVALIIGLFFEVRIEGLYWMLMHSPMFIISLYSFWLGMKDPYPSTPPD